MRGGFEAAASTGARGGHGLGGGRRRRRLLQCLVAAAAKPQLPPQTHCCRHSRRRHSRRRLPRTAAAVAAAAATKPAPRPSLLQRSTAAQIVVQPAAAESPRTALPRHAPRRQQVGSTLGRRCSRTLRGVRPGPLCSAPCRVERIAPTVGIVRLQRRSRTPGPALRRLVTRVAWVRYPRWRSLRLMLQLSLMGLFYLVQALLHNLLRHNLPVHDLLLQT